MPKSDKELAVEITCAVIHASALRAQSSVTPVRPLTGEDVSKILADAYSAVSSLGSSSAQNPDR